MTDPDPVIRALEESLEQNPRNPAVWKHLADLYLARGDHAKGIDALRNAASTGGDEPQVITALVRELRRAQQFSEALIRAEGLFDKIADRELGIELARVHAARGDVEATDTLLAKLGVDRAVLEAEPVVGADAPSAVVAKPAPVAPAESSPLPERTEEEVPGDDGFGEDDDRLATVTSRRDEEDLDTWASQFDWGDLHVTFDDVAGLDDVKRQIKLRIIAPQKHQNVYQAFQRSAGGGILLYGPPGCGKTFVARATAGECGARFISVAIHEIVDKYWGESEKAVHALFEEARRKTPTVLFFDEFDALGSARNNQDSSQFWKTLVDALLQEMDGIGSKNEDILVFAATNMPWHVDAAFRRPGRFDRLFFVPPPDDKGRKQILDTHVAKLPGGDKISVRKLVKATPLWTGADLKSLAERASERALEASLDSGSIHPVTMDDFGREIVDMSSSALEWLNTAKNYARFSNDGGQYDNLAKYLRKVRKW